MTERVRVRNITTFNVGLKAQNGIEYNIKPGTFQMMNREDVEYNMAVAPKLFSTPARLVVEDEGLNEMMGIDHTTEEIIDAAVVEKMLKGSAAKLRTWLEENKEPQVLELVCQAAQKMDLPVSKMKVVQEFVPTRDLTEE
jgi:hypothetical protein